MIAFTCIGCGDSAKRDSHIRRPFCFPCAARHLSEAKAAISEVRKAIYRGDLPKARDCICVDCGQQAYDYDHRDYVKPLDVVPVCRGCNQRRGKAFNSFVRPLVEAA
jgi:hypothetical protein